MKRFLLVLILPMLACGGFNTPVPSSPTPAPVTQTSSPLTLPPPNPTQVPPTDTPTSPATFPDLAAFDWQLISSGLDRPVDVQPDGTGRLFIIEKLGHIHVYQNGALVEEPFLKIDDRVNDFANEMGLLGLAFHPDFAQNSYFYVNYTGEGGDTFISRFTSSGDSAEPASEVILLRDRSACYVDADTQQKHALYAVRSGCINSLIAADGVLSVPNFAVNCICNYPVQTAFAMVHDGDGGK